MSMNQQAVVIINELAKMRPDQYWEFLPELRYLANHGSDVASNALANYAAGLNFVAV